MSKQIPEAKTVHNYDIMLTAAQARAESILKAEGVPKVVSICTEDGKISKFNFRLEQHNDNTNDEGN